MNRIKPIHAALLGIALLYTSIDAAADTIDFRDNGNITTAALTEGIVTVTGSGLVRTSIQGLGIDGGGAGTGGLDLGPGETMTFSFATPVADVTLIDIVPTDIGNNGVALNATLESFDASGTSTALVVTPLDTFSAIQVSQILGVAGMSSFSITMNNDAIRVGGISFSSAETVTLAYDFEASNFDDVFGGTPSPVESVSGSFGFTYERGAGDPVSIVVPDFVNLSIFGLEYAPQDTVVRIFDNGGNVTVIFGGAPDATSSFPFTNDFQLSFLVSPSGEVLLPFDFSYRIESILFGWFTLPPNVVINQRLLDPISLINLLAADMIGTGPGTSFTDKLLQARAYVEAGDDQAACEMLNAFLNQVSAQNGKKLTLDEASQAESDANAIAELIGCN